MKEFDYVIIGGGCAGLSLAYELEVHKKLEDKKLAIIESRDEYKRDSSNIRKSMYDTLDPATTNNDQGNSHDIEGAENRKGIFDISRREPFSQSF